MSFNYEKCEGGKILWSLRCCIVFGDLKNLVIGKTLTLIHGHTFKRIYVDWWFNSLIVWHDMRHNDHIHKLS